jgi:ABC-type uncharacterized transport system involved in gliding motility auxiliary subunit
MLISIPGRLCPSETGVEINKSVQAASLTYRTFRLRTQALNSREKPVVPPELQLKRIYGPAASANKKIEEIDSRGPPDYFKSRRIEGIIL